jgi:hypothetical protein
MTVEELAVCIEAANGNNGAINKCKKDFKEAGGTEGAQQGGKVFSDTNGGKVFVTDGGKVFNNRA